MLNNVNKIHFIGIGGIGMCGIAEVLLSMGYKITGSDRNLSEITQLMQELGIKVFEGHKKENIQDVQLVVYSSAISKDNPEMLEAKARSIRTVRRAEILGELVSQKIGIAIAGTHGKTTTSSMVAMVVQEANLDPTIIIGGRLKSLGGDTAKFGNGKYIVVEADEFDRSFLKLSPKIAAITNLEREHLDTYKNIEEIKEAFIDFANKVPEDGFVVLCYDDKGIKEIIPSISKRIITYGLSDGVNVKAFDILHSESSSNFKVEFYGKYLGEVKLNIPGLHNVKNSLVAVVIAKELGIDFEVTRSALEKFSGVSRRFEIKAFIKNIMVIDDYAHHPTEVAATLDALRAGWKRRVVAVFQPHLFTRTRDFYNDFAKVFLNSDLFICTEIYPAREEPIDGITGEMIVDSAKKLGHKNAIYIKNKSEIPEILLKSVNAGDTVITFGAGDIWKYGELYIEKLKKENGDLI